MKRKYYRIKQNWHIINDLRICNKCKEIGKWKKNLI